MTCAGSVLLKVRNSISIYDHTKVTSVLASVAISRQTYGIDRLNPNFVQLIVSIHAVAKILLICIRKLKNLTEIQSV